MHKKNRNTQYPRRSSSFTGSFFFFFFSDSSLSSHSKSLCFCCCLLCYRQMMTDERQRKRATDLTRTPIHTQTHGDELSKYNRTPLHVLSLAFLTLGGDVFFLLLLLCFLRRILLFFFSLTGASAASALQRNFLPFIAHIFFISCAFFFCRHHQWSNFGLLLLADAVS